MGYPIEEVRKLGEEKAYKRPCPSAPVKSYLYPFFGGGIGVLKSGPYTC
jgi:hypothetical protein